MAIIMCLSACQPAAPSFNAERAFQDVQKQGELGPRTPGSDAHAQVISYITHQFSKNDSWSVNVSADLYEGHTIQNIVAKRGSGSPWIILGAHYDSRLWADHDPDLSKRQSPVPGADDGASGVAVLLELSRSLPVDLQKQIWLVFFDAEDQGEIPGWDWILGSQDFVNQLPKNKPDAFIFLDMVGDKDLNIYYEANSDKDLSQQLFSIAAKKGYASQFIPQTKYQMLDDHTPFIIAGIPSVDLIDFDYPYWHTTQDTTDKISSQSLGAVGETVLAWLLDPQSPKK
jgi:Zn-dependent M28 family amino/carboxypeptidase